MTDRFIHPQCFTTKGQNPDIADCIAESELNCGFVIVRDLFPKEELENLQKAAAILSSERDRDGEWKRYWRGRARNVETTPITAENPELADCVGQLATRFHGKNEIIDQRLLRYNRRAGTGLIGERLGALRVDVSLLGRMTLGVWERGERKAVTTLKPGDALILSGGLGMPKYHSWNTTKRVDSDERTQRIGLAFRYKTR